MAKKQTPWVNPGKLVVVFVVLFGFFRVNAETDTTLFFSNLTNKQGLCSNITTSVVQDKYGFIWIGTMEGLCRYDGYKMICFQNNKSSCSIPSNNITTLLYDDDLIWIGCRDGLCTVDTRTFKITRINVGGEKAIRALYKDRKGLIWIGTSDGLLKYDRKENAFTYINSSSSGLTHNTVRCFYEDGRGRLWIGTYDGLNKYEEGKISGFNLKGNYKPLLKNNLVCSIGGDPYSGDSVLWVGTETGLAMFNPADGSYKLFNKTNTSLSNEVIKCIYLQNDSLLWLGTDFGLDLFNMKTGKVRVCYHDPLVNSTIANNVVWEIFEDRQKRLWLITSGGVSMVDNGASFYRLNEEFFSFRDPRIGNQIRDILVARDGNIWMATIHGVICRNPKTGERETFSTSSAENRKLLLDNVYALCEDDKGRIWIGTAGGINIWDRQQSRMSAVTASRENGLTSNYISGFARQKDGTFWLSAWEGGLFNVKWDGKYPANMKFIPVDPDGYGRLVANDCGDIFYSTNDQLWRIDDHSFEKYAVRIVNDLIADHSITALASGAGGFIWIGADNLLLKYNPQTGSVFHSEIDAGRSHTLINLEEDSNGDIWGTTQNTIVRMKKGEQASFIIPIDPNSPLKDFYNYCSAVTGEGHILFGGDNGYVEIAPDDIVDPMAGPAIFLSGLLVNNQGIISPDSSKILSGDISFMEHLDLKYNQNSVTFEFSTLDYLFPDKGQYRYRLLPGQEEWVNTSGDKNFAVFSNLKPGDYVFEVKGTNRLGFWSNPKNLSIHISPPLWLSTGFIVFYIILLLVVVWSVFRIYNYRQKLKNELQIIKLEKQHSEEMYQAKIQFFTNVSHEFRTPLSLILSPIQQLLKNATLDEHYGRMLRLANMNARRLYRLVNQLLDFRKIEASKLELDLSGIEIISFCSEIFVSFEGMASQHEIRYSFFHDSDSCFITADREKLETIIFNLLSNAFKYTPHGGEISLHISFQGKGTQTESIKIGVKDSGTGIPKEDQPQIFDLFFQSRGNKPSGSGSGIGLTLAKEYALLHQGNITVESGTGHGSLFTLILPVLNRATTETSPGTIGEKNCQLRSDNDQYYSELPPYARKVLIVEDNYDILEYLELNLRDTYRVLRAMDGFAGLEIVKEHSPDLIISDIMMPVMDGITFCAEIRQNKKTVHIPVILLTAKTLDQDKTEGMTKGADMYITKPFDIEYLKSCVSSIFRREDRMGQYIKQQLQLRPQIAGDKGSRNTKELFLKKVMAIIDRNLGNPDLSVEMISDNMGMSATHLYRKLKEMTGYSTREIIINYRMQKAALMLENKEGNISEIMYAVGFSSLSGFSKSFKSKFGVSPSNYHQDTP